MNIITLQVFGMYCLWVACGYTTILYFIHSALGTINSSWSS